MIGVCADRITLDESLIGVCADIVTLRESVIGVSTDRIKLFCEATYTEDPNA